MSNLAAILPKITGQYRFNAPLKNWFNTESYAEILFKPKDEADLINFLQNFPHKEAIKIIGATSNIVFKNKLTKGVVIKLSGGLSQIELQDNNIIYIKAATLCKNVANFLQNNSLSNLEFLTGIPGSIGGAIAMNAGCYGSEIANFLISATAIDLNGNICQFNNKDFGFFYRGSELVKKSGDELIFISAKFQCISKDSNEVAKTIQQFNQQREENQPIRAKTGGSTFKNPEDSDKKAWQLIDDANCRGLKIGDAQISQKHCNFLINQGQATGQDIIDLIKKVQDQVELKSNIKLQTEVKIIR